MPYNKNLVVAFGAAALVVLIIVLLASWPDEKKVDNLPPANPEIVCTDYGAEDCPAACVVCPPCPECSSISCQSEEFCAQKGIDRSWYEGIKKTLGDGTSAVCAVENCHGLEIKCGPNPAEVCTAMYQLGDKCLQYASCGLVDNQCQPTLSAKFVSCKACVDKCSEDYRGDVVQMFNCEAQCQ